ncbi:tRNA 4-thiouridine(8) synthase ThiI [Candidatus Woesearchaeota archaeon]|nr:tRNA 4-thiouridine(8) synthase ThiI [Candidatus Woesearchaeota archaeon]
MNHIIIHYSEIGTKGNNRDFFEKKLVENIKKSLGDVVSKVYRRYGRIIGVLQKKIEVSEVVEVLDKLPGISNFSFALKSKLDIKDIKKKAVEVLREQEFTSFKAETKRSNKDFPLTSPEVNGEVGGAVIEELGKKVDVKNPEMRVFIEIGEKEAFVYSYKYSGVGGLPVGTAGKVISSLSGGIDSPVASFLLMKRGCKVIFVHILNKTQARGALTKVEELVEQLTKIQLNSKLYIVPFEKIQKEIIMKVPSKLRMIVYRRFMMQIINQIVKMEGAKGIVTGDSVGQVASQTLENINCIYDAASWPVFAPLIGTNKEEIVNLAKQIGTYELSIQPYPDCCSFMIAKHPETKGNLKVVQEVEAAIEDAEKLIAESVVGAEVKKFSF